MRVPKRPYSFFYSEVRNCTVLLERSLKTDGRLGSTFRIFTKVYETIGHTNQRLVWLTTGSGSTLKLCISL